MRCDAPAKVLTFCALRFTSCVRERRMASSKRTGLYQRATQVLPGGVTAAARVNAALGEPFYVARAEGPFLYDMDGRRYVDACTSNGASLLGHSHPAVVA